jgi:hypothetical protein
VPVVAETPAVWRCPVCEGVNRGGRTCSTCGEQLPPGFVPVDAAAQPRVPRAPAHPPVAPRPTVVAPPRTPRFPSPEEIFGSNPFR